MKRRALGALLATRALSWQPPAHRVAELFPPTADALARNADPDAVFVVTGANRGVGAAMVEQLAARTAGTVVGQVDAACGASGQGGCAARRVVI